MELSGTRALQIWGLCHQLRLEEDDSKITKAGRRADRIAAIRRERDMLIEFYSQYTQRGQLTPKAAERVKAVKARADKEIHRIRAIGFCGPEIPTNDVYARSSKARKPQINPESAIALTFIVVEDYLRRRPMQRALAWRVYVLGETLGGFKYSEPIGAGQTHSFCSCRQTATVIHRNLKERLEMLLAIGSRS